MDELLQEPRNTGKAGQDALRERLIGFAEVLREKTGAAWEDAQPRLRSARQWLSRNPISPAVFLAVAMTVGIGSVVGTVYRPSYVVTVDGVDIGAVAETAVFDRAVKSVESRATRILGYEYEMESDVEFSRALTERDEFASSARLETYLFNQIGEVMKSYVLTVNGTTIGAADEKADLDNLLETVSAPYRTENTIEYGFVEDVAIQSEYISSDTNTNLEDMYAALTANTTGATTYTVVQGDTYSQIAAANDMKLSELMALNPEANIDKLMIGDVLNIKQVVPFLSVYTVDNITYTKSIESPVEYREDSSLYVGDTKTITKGTDGTAQVNANVTYVNGYESERTVLETTTLTEPTTTVIAKGTKEKPKTASTGTYIWPVSGRVTSKFGYRTIFGSYSYHSGIDIAAPYGTAVKAADGGKVTYSGWMSGYGYLIIITHDNGAQTYYGHNSSLVSKVGDRVYQGQTIAKVGSTGRSTGNHCHFEVRVNGSARNPYNYL